MQTNAMHSWKHSKDTVNDVHAIKLCKTDLGTSSLYFGLSRRVNGGGEVVTDFIFEMSEHKEQLINCIKYISMECS